MEGTYLRCLQWIQVICTQDVRDEDYLCETQPVARQFVVIFAFILVSTYSFKNVIFLLKFYNMVNLLLFVLVAK